MRELLVAEGKVVAAKAGAETVAEAREEETAEAQAGVGWAEEKAVTMVVALMVVAAVRREGGGKRVV